MQPNLERALHYINSHEKTFSSKEIQKAHEDLSACYRSKGKTQDIHNEAMVAAYVSARMPATHAVINTCLQKIATNFAPTSLLDLGAGPGTVTLAALDLWPELKTATLVEHQPSMGRFSKGLFDSLNLKTTFEHLQKDVTNFSLSTKYDLVTLGYVLGELNQDQQFNVLKKAFDATKEFLVITMPGTPHDYKTLMLARDFLIRKGGHIIAPCPHNNKCPLEITEDWCHFSVRLHRTKSHKHIKQGVLSYEDEKFSYLIISKKEACQDFARILRKPIKRPGHILLDLCIAQGTKREIITKSQKDIYKNASKIMWGDAW
ncbi:MAG: small ribosomal subunit Rsm22 family protein [Alphaproteobacteria bacterium]|nr:small ribosomal subunit Rsm22 family protein [Alphaproteobacteria bacterium]